MPRNRSKKHISRNNNKESSLVNGLLDEDSINSCHIEKSSVAELQLECETVSENCKVLLDDSNVCDNVFSQVDSVSVQGESLCQPFLETTDLAEQTFDSGAIQTCLASDSTGQEMLTVKSVDVQKENVISSRNNTFNDVEPCDKNSVKIEAVNYELTPANEISCNEESTYVNAGIETVSYSQESSDSGENDVQVNETNDQQQSKTISSNVDGYESSANFQFDIKHVQLTQQQIDIVKNSCCQQCLEKLNCNNNFLKGNVQPATTYASMIDEETADIYEVQMAALEKTITQLQREVDIYRDKLNDQETIHRNALSHLRFDLSTKLEKAIKQLEVTERDKEAAVVKFAQSEASILTIKKTMTECDRKVKEMTREKESLLNKIRLLMSDKVRLGQSLDTKSSEIIALQRDYDKLKEDVASKDIKIKWAQNKLKTEMDTHQETVMKLEKAEHKLKEMREEAEQIRRNCQEMVRTYQESEEVRSNTLGIKLRERESELKQERQEKSNQEEVHYVIQRELDTLKKKHKLILDENNTLTIKVQCLERERLDYEENIGKSKEQSNQRQQEIVDLQAKLVEMDNLLVQIDRQKEKIGMGQTEIERLRQSNVELQIDMDACRRKEGELLEFTERLTSKNVLLQSEYSCLEMKCQAQERELTKLTKLSEELEQQNSILTSQLSEEQQLRKQDTQILARKLAEKTRAFESMNVKFDEQKNENKVLRRKNACSIRELTREVQTLRRQLDSYETCGNVESKSLGSRASSSNSLDTICLKDSTAQASRMFAQFHVNDHLTEGFDNMVVSIEPTQQMLIERIVKLQRAHARKNEKIEFLEEHVNQLVNELKKKSKLIQNYVMREEAGTLSTSCMDQHKDAKGKIEQSKRGGIMASLYTSQQADCGLTLDLSLEINRKLQAVLEDTLLKNITLKENIKTLGEEVARLSNERRGV